MAAIGPSLLESNMQSVKLQTNSRMTSYQSSTYPQLLPPTHPLGFRFSLIAFSRLGHALVGTAPSRCGTVGSLRAPDHGAPAAAKAQTERGELIGVGRETCDLDRRTLKISQVLIANMQQSLHSYGKRETSFVTALNTCVKWCQYLGNARSLIWNVKNDVKTQSTVNQQSAAWDLLSIRMPW